MANIPSLPLEIVNKLVNVGGLQKKLRCRKCKKYTEHVSVSYSVLAKEKELGWKVVGRIYDLLPSWPLVAGNTYVCSKCGEVRWEGGLLSDLFNS